ncbi:MAG: type II toxin-antitoxin system HicB family antitoxin [Candidatus Paceibacterota bacterium]|jgi:predicted RNase H-like HicB family nuclease
MTTENQFNVVLKKTKKWFIGWVEEFPGVNSQGKTLKELRQNLREALLMVIDANKTLVRKDLNQSNSYRRELLKIQVPA